MTMAQMVPVEMLLWWSSRMVVDRDSTGSDVSVGGYFDDLLVVTDAGEMVVGEACADGFEDGVVADVAQVHVGHVGDVLEVEVSLRDG